MESTSSISIFKSFLVWVYSVGFCHGDFFNYQEIFLLKDLSNTFYFKLLRRLGGGQNSCEVSGLLSTNAGVRKAHRAINSPSSRGFCNNEAGEKYDSWN